MDKKNTFEQAITELEDIVSKLEKGEDGLEESLALFEKGTSLAERCNKLLSEAEQKVTVLLKDKETSEVVDRDFMSAQDE